MAGWNLEPEYNDLAADFGSLEAVFALEGERLTRDPLRIVNGEIAVPEAPGLGVEIDMEQVEQAHALYRRLGSGARDDAAAMQYLIPGWKFDPKRPALVR